MLISTFIENDRMRYIVCIIGMMLVSAGLFAQTDSLKSFSVYDEDSLRILTTSEPDTSELSEILDVADHNPFIDTTQSQQTTAKVRDTLRQFRFSIDLSRPLASFIQKDRNGLELMFDYYWRKELYLVLEGGAGNSNYDYPDLRYRSKNAFMRVGIDKSMIPRMSPKDWDMVFIGARYGLALINLSEADYVTYDPYWGSVSGKLPARNFAGHWLEVTGGMRVEMFSGFFIGWNARGRFLLNRGAFKELAPVYVAGYGKGDKNGIFDFNFYLSYAFR